MDNLLYDVTRNKITIEIRTLHHDFTRQKFSYHFCSPFTWNAVEDYPTQWKMIVVYVSAHFKTYILTTYNISGQYIGFKMCHSCTVNWLRFVNRFTEYYFMICYAVQFVIDGHHRYGKSHAIFTWDQVLPATQQRWLSAFTSTEGGTWFSNPGRMQGWVDVGGVYIPR